MSYEKSMMTQLALLEYREEFDGLLPAHVLDGDNATKENVVDRVTKGSSSLVHFLVHGSPGGKDAASIEFNVLCSLAACMLLVLENKKKKRVNKVVRGF